MAVSGWLVRAFDRVVPTIRGKVVAILVATGAVSVVCACATFAVVLVYTLRADQVRVLSTVAEVIGQNNRMAIASRDGGEVSRALSSLRAKPSIERAWVYDVGGRLVASYRRDDVRADVPVPVPTDDDRRVTGGMGKSVRVWRRLNMDGAPVGTVCLQDDMRDVSGCVRRSLLVLAVVAVLSLVVVLGVAGWLQGLVVHPVLSLVRTAHAVSERKDYTVRVEAQRRDELGMLTRAFNEMLTVIQDSQRSLEGEIAERIRIEEALRRHQDRLEDIVADRTGALAESNRQLTGEVRRHVATERRLEATCAKLLRSNAELEQFAYVASHDLQEPLRKIMAFGDRLLQRHSRELSCEGADFLQRILNSTTRMQRLINDLLMYSRVATRPPAMRPIDLNAVVSRVLDELAPRIQEIGAVVTVGALPVIDGERSCLFELFRGLLDNALKYRNTDRVTEVDITAVWPIAAALDGGDVPACQLSVSDNGIGFDPKYGRRIFQIFQRLHPRHEYAGTGIGLALVERVCARYHGRVSVESVPGKGSVFTVILPLRQSVGLSEAAETSDDQYGVSCVAPVGDEMPHGAARMPVDAM